MKYCFVLIFLPIIIVDANIHRAVPGSIPASISKSSNTKTSNIVIEDEDADEFVGYFNNAANKSSWTLISALIASILVGSTGIFPLLIFKVKDGKSLKEAISPNHLKLLLSFAVGGLLGDVFLHLLPEAWMYVADHDHVGHIKIGLWIIAGLLSFMIIEKIFMEEEKVRESLEYKKNVKEQISVIKNVAEVNENKNDVKVQNGHIKTNDNAHKNGLTMRSTMRGECDLNTTTNSGKRETNGLCNEDDETVVESNEYSSKEIKVIGYLNLLANCSDNFTHGLAVAGSFSVSIPVGICTTIAILVHEIPHEIGDFAILLKAGFNRVEAAKGQILTASGALFGCMFGLLAESAGDASSWILPYTSGGFIYISMVTLIPDLVKEDGFRESMKQTIFLLAGICCMGFVSMMHH